MENQKASDSMTAGWDFERVSQVRAQLPRPQTFVSIQGYWAKSLQILELNQISLRSLAQRLSVSAAHLCFLKSGKRNAKASLLVKWSRLWSLSSTDEDSLMALNGLLKKSAKKKTESFRKLKRKRNFALEHPERVAAFDYLDRWQNIVLRELVAVLPDRADPRDFQSQMVKPLRTMDVEKSLQFLVRSGFLIKKDSSTLALPDQSALKLDSDTERFVYGNHHKQMLALASQAIDELPRDERHLLSFTVALDPEHYSEAIRIFQEALSKIRALREKCLKPDRVYTFGTYAFAQSRPPKPPTTKS